MENKSLIEENERLRTILNDVVKAVHLSDKSEQEKTWYQIIQVIMDNYHAHNYPEQAVNVLSRKYIIHSKNKTV